MKKTPLKRKSKSEIKKVQDELWDLCKQIIRLKYPNNCYTCPAKRLEGRNWQTGHMWAKASLGSILKYDLRILRPQCYHCNHNLGGMGAIFYEKMQREEGYEFISKLEIDRIKSKTETTKALPHYKQLIIEYRKILADLWKEHGY